MGMGKPVSIQNPSTTDRNEGVRFDCTRGRKEPKWGHRLIHGLFVEQSIVDTLYFFITILSRRRSHRLLCNNLIDM